MEFVEELVVGGKRRFEEIADFVVGKFGMSLAVALEDAAGVGVDDEDGMFAGIEKYGVGGFRADAPQIEQLFAKERSCGGEHFGERAAVGIEEKFDERFESFGFLAEVSGRAKELREVRGGHLPDGKRRK